MKVVNLSKTYRTKSGEVKALEGLNFDLPESGIVFILGNSGSGKTTLLNLLSGLDKADDGGRIEVCGKDIVSCTESERDGYRNSCCGFVFQEYNLIPELNVSENIKLSCELNGEKDNDKRIADTLKLVELEGYGDRKVTELSGGQKQRVAIARAIVKEPKIVFADEPTGALDETTGESIFELLKGIAKDKLVIVVSHDREFAEKYGDRIIELKDGKITSDNGSDYIENRQAEIQFKKPKLPFKTAAKIGCANFKTHPIRLVATVLLSVIAFGFLGICLNIAISDPRDNYFKAVRESGMEYAIILKQKVNKDYNGVDQSLDRFFGDDTRWWDDVIMSPDDGEIFKDYYCGPIAYVQELQLGEFHKMVTMSLEKIGEETVNDPRIFEISADGVMYMSDEDCKKFGFTVTGRLPENKNEIAINEGIFNTFQYGGMTVDGVNYTFETPEDILGFEIYMESVQINENGVVRTVVDHKKRTVVGVVNTGCNKECFSSHYFNHQNNSTAQASHPHRKIFVSDDFVEHGIYADGSFVIIPIDDDFEKIANFIFDYEKDETRYILSQSTALGYNFAVSYMTYIKFWCLYLGIIFLIAAVILLVNFIGTSIRKQMKQIGILTAMGADKKSLIKIYGSSAAVICGAVFALSSAVFGALVHTVVNDFLVGWANVSFRIVGFAPLAMLLLLLVIAAGGAIGLFVPLLKMRKITPADAIGKGAIK